MCWTAQELQLCNRYNHFSLLPKSYLLEEAAAVRIEAAAVRIEASLLCVQLQRIATEGAFAGLVGGSPGQTQARLRVSRKELKGIDQAKVTACVAGAGAARTLCG